MSILDTKLATHILDKLFAYVAFLDVDGRVVEVNKAPVSRAGFQREDVIGQFFYDAPWWSYDPQIRQQLIDAISLAKLGKTVRYDVDVQMGEDLVPIDFQISPIYNTEQQLVGFLPTAVDISSRKKAEAQYLSLFVATRDALVIFDLTGTCLDGNPAALSMFECRDVDELRSKALAPFSPQFEPDERCLDDKAREMIAITLEQGSHLFEWMHIRKDQSQFPIEVLLTRIYVDGKPLIVSNSRDISERKATEAKLKLAAKVFTHAREGIIISDANANIIDTNDAFTRITGYSRSEVLGQNTLILQKDTQTTNVNKDIWAALYSKGHWYGETWSRRKNAEVFAQMLTISAITDEIGRIESYVSLFSDITALKQHQQQLEHIAHYDPLTNLPNRLLLADRLRQAMVQTQRRELSMAVAYIDLDGFKEVNDNYGHKFGDELLISVSQRMHNVLREGDTLSRIGGDEFIAVLADLDKQQDYYAIFQRLLMAAGDPINVDGKVIKISASIGITIYPEDVSEADQLLRHADQAMYQAKQSGKNRFTFYDPKAELVQKNLLDQREQIERGLNANEFELHYQPKVFLHSNQIAGLEALIRWRHPERGLLTPEAFLPYIDSLALEICVGEWVIDTALQQIEDWLKKGLDFTVSINISADHLQSPNFVAGLRQKLIRHPSVSPRHLQVEILETAALTDFANVANIITECAEIGVSFALDDFGTGYSSLSYLRRLPAETLKIDLSFVRDMLVDKEDHAIVKGVIALAKTFSRSTVAEGVESVEHIEVLRDMGCDIAQGYGIARPMPACEVFRWCQKYSSVIHNS
jgi:diguanylate cyclase (GGDEF)-like protein/PAS domain S-box-containing protein